MKIAIIGSRSFNNEAFFGQTMEKLEFQISQIISGGAKGADSLAEVWAIKNQIPLVIHHPDWKKYGRAAGIIRNKTIIEECEYCLVFWDQKSYGTKFSIDYCTKLGKTVHIVDTSVLNQ